VTCHQEFTTVLTHCNSQYRVMCSCLENLLTAVETADPREIMAELGKLEIHQDSLSLHDTRLYLKAEQSNPEGHQADLVRERSHLLKRVAALNHLLTEKLAAKMSLLVHDLDRAHHNRRALRSYQPAPGPGAAFRNTS